MSSIKLKHASGNSVSIAAPQSNPASDRTLYLPSNADGTVLTTTYAKAGNIIQVVQGIKKDTSSNSTSATSYWNTDVTVAITPSHASNKILLTGYIQVGVAGPQHNIGVGIHKAGSLLTDYLGDSAGSRSRVGTNGDNMPDGGYTNAMGNIIFEYLDTAGGTSAITYGIALRNPSSIARTLKINYAETDTDNVYHQRATSVITAMEVAV